MHQWFLCTPGFLCFTCLCDFVACYVCFSPWCNTAVNQFSHAVEESFANRHRLMEIKVLGQTLRCILTFVHLLFTVCRHTHLLTQKSTQMLTHKHTTYSERTQQRFKDSSIFKWKCIYSAVISAFDC